MQELGASFEESGEIPAEIKSLVEEYREKLVEAAVELDDDVMEAYLEVCSADLPQDCSLTCSMGLICRIVYVSTACSTNTRAVWTWE